MDARELLAEAADRLESDDLLWVQGEYGQGTKDSAAMGCKGVACAAGAIFLVATDGQHCYADEGGRADRLSDEVSVQTVQRAFEELVVTVKGKLPRPGLSYTFSGEPEVAEWNDDMNQTSEAVIAGLRAAAVRREESD
jgi:hypothetical protein